jgi:hypothetical protein
VGRKSVVFQTLYFAFLEEFLALWVWWRFWFLVLGGGVFVFMEATKVLFLTE